MLIKVKIIDDNGQPKGRGYTYKSDIDVNVGDMVLADMAGKDKILTVTEINVPEEKTDFEIKTIKGLAGILEIDNLADEQEEVPTLEFTVKKEVLPVIQINFKEMKAALEETLTEYDGIVVTEQSLSTCKGKQRDLASLRVKIDNYRKDKKKELSRPIKAFEDQCKELISLIEKAEQPIKDGIKIFDDEKRDSKRLQAIELAKEVAEEYGLNEKYADRLEILDKYCNLTAKSNEIREDLISKAMTLKVEQDRETELIEIIKDTIASENEKINLKMKFEDFEKYINRGMTAREVIVEVKERANNIYVAENPPEPEPKPEPIFIPTIIPVQEVIPEPAKEPIKPFEPIQEDPTYYATYRVVGNVEELRSVSQFLRQNNIQYTVLEQDEL